MQKFGAKLRKNLHICKKSSNFVAFFETTIKNNNLKLVFSYEEDYVYCRSCYVHGSLLQQQQVLPEG